MINYVEIRFWGRDIIVLHMMGNRIFRNFRGFIIIGVLRIQRVGITTTLIGVVFMCIYIFDIESLLAFFDYLGFDEGLGVGDALNNALIYLTL